MARAPRGSKKKAAAAGSTATTASENFSQPKLFSGISKLNLLLRCFRQHG